jgi:glutamate-5-semialdehyde dehydrogenase
MLQKLETATDALLRAIGARARGAVKPLALAGRRRKDAALHGMADALLRSESAILEANRGDMARGRESGLPAAALDRLRLDAPRVHAMAQALRTVAGLPDPVGAVMESWEQPNGLRIERVRTPLGVIGVIFESRPNVTADAGALCLKSGNPVILRAGSDALASAAAIHACLVEGLALAGLPEGAIQLVPTPDRAAVGLMLAGLDGNLDVIVPRGGRSLVERVQREARVPVFAHLEGLCHLYVDRSADLEMAKRIAVNAKMRRTGVCGAAETLLVDEAVAATYLVPLLETLRDAGCAVRGSEEVVLAFSDATPASEADWRTEYLDAIISVRTVKGVAGAIEHIERYSSHHTEAIVAEDAEAVSRFMAEVDSAILLHNASTQFADGGEFGFGGEIGIATGRMHARGPVGVEQLTSFKYRVHGAGQVRP